MACCCHTNSVVVPQELSDASSSQAAQQPLHSLRTYPFAHLVPFLLGRLATGGQGGSPQVLAQKWLSTMYHSRHLPKARCCFEMGGGGRRVREQLQGTTCGGGGHITVLWGGLHPMHCWFWSGVSLHEQVLITPSHQLRTKPRAAAHLLSTRVLAVWCNVIANSRVAGGSKAATTTATSPGAGGRRGG